MTGLPIVFGDHRSPHATYMQAAGSGKRISSTDLRKATRTSQSLRDSLLKFVQVFGVQTTQTAICNALSRIDRRLARWLLMCHDRVEGDELTLTQEFIAQMLGTRRSGVSEAMRADYVEMARLSGIPERRVVLRHALRNALAPTVQVFALTIQYLIGGIVIVETVFAYPGLGQGLVQAVVARDIPTVQGVAMLLAAIYIVINIAADLIVVLLIPKLRTSR